MQQAENEPPHAITLPHRCDSIVSALAWVFVNSQKPRIALEAGAPADAPAGGIAADSLAPRRVGALVYPIAERHVDHVVLVTDDAIIRAQQILWDTLRVVTEPGRAAAFAALLSGRYEPRPGEHIGIVLSGGNTTAVNFGS